MRYIGNAALALFFATTLHAKPQEWVPRLGARTPVPFTTRELNTTYRIGSEWGKKPITADDLEQEPNLRTIANGTARVGGATGFYIGLYNGHHLVATNHHVCPTSCLGTNIWFPKLDITARANKFYGTWDSVDFAIFAIELNDAQAAKLQPFATPIDFRSPIYREQPLITVGFGAANNPRRELMANRDSDCKVFSAENEFRLMPDPDRLNPGPYKAWSFANGCDVSHGDSGSAMVDRETGKIVGIIWTGRIPKKKVIQDSAYLDQLLQSGGEEIWDELSYSVPAQKIAEVLKQAAQASSDADMKTTFQELMAE